MLNSPKSALLRFMRSTDVNEAVAIENQGKDLTCSPAVEFPAWEPFRHYLRGMY